MFQRIGVIAGLGASLLIAAAAQAADISIKAPVAALATPAPWLNPFAGVAVDPSGWFADAGFVAAFNGNLNQPGWLLRVRGGGGHYEYNRTAILKQDVGYEVGEIMFGYQTFFGSTRVSIYGGGNVEHHNNNDPLALIAGTKGGFKTQGEIFSSFAPGWYALLLGTYSTAYNSYFTMGKIGYKVTNTISIGPEVAALGNDRFDAIRVGPFVGIDLTPSVMLIVSGGYSWDGRRNSVNDNSGAYGTIHIRSLF